MLNKPAGMAVHGGSGLSFGVIEALRVLRPQAPYLELVHRLAGESDVFITNLTQDRLQRYKLTDADIHALAPAAIYAVLSGYGTEGPDSERQAFDQTAFWARSGDAT